jgi:hypothetical protein
LAIDQGAGLEPENETPTNLLIVTFDTTRADYLRCYGHPETRSATIDSLAREGVLFSRAYVQVPQTLPSHVSLFTGLYPFTHGIVSNGQKLEDRFITLAEVLEDEIFDLWSDPKETENLLSQGKGHHRQEELEAALARWASGLDDLSDEDLNLSPEQKERLESLGYVQ